MIFFYLSDAGPDNYCYINPLVPIKVMGFVQETDGEEYVIGLRFKTVKNYFEEPFESQQTLGISYVSDLDHVEQKFNVRDVASKIICLPSENGFVVIPMLHHCVS